MAAAILRVLPHRLEPTERRAGLMHAAFARHDAVATQHLIEHEGPAGAGDVRDQRAAAQVRDAFDMRLNEQPVEAVVAAHDHQCIGAGERQRDALIGGAMGDLVAPGRQPLALLLRVRRWQRV